MAGQLIKRGAKVWTARIYLGRTADGTRQYQNHTIHGTKKDAQTWLTDALKKKDLGIPTFQSKVNLSDYIDEWLKTAAKPRVSETTYRGYQWQLQHVKDALGKARLSQLRAEDIQRLYGGLSPSTARHVHAPLRSALSQAVKWHLIHSNACDAVDLPRHKAREVQALTRDEAARLMAVERFTRKEEKRSVIVENRYRVLFAFLLNSGARPSEAFGLKWSDIDFETGRVTIQRTLQWHSKQQGGGWYFEETKTKMSRRAVPLPTGLIQQLREHRATQAEALLKLGVRTDIVFATSEGTPILRRNLVRRHFKPALAAAKLPADFSLYGLRHTCATLLLQAGTHPKVVAERLGHSSTTLTMDVYSHVMPGMQSEATTQLERLLYG
jgi:integrase